MAKLTHKQQRFIEEYVIDGNATQAAIRAGYSENTAYSIGEENLKKPEIKEMIEKLQHEQSEKAGITAEYVLSGIRDIAEKKDARDSDKLKAYELLGRNLSLFTDVTKAILPEGYDEIQTMVVRCKSMSDEELKLIKNDLRRELLR